MKGEDAGAIFALCRRWAKRHVGIVTLAKVYAGELHLNTPYPSEGRKMETQWGARRLSGRDCWMECSVRVA